MSDKDSPSGYSDDSRCRRSTKNTSSRSNFSGQSSRSFGDGSAGNSSVPSKLADIQAISFVSSPLSVFRVLSTFESRKKDIVESIGFGGILSLPCITYENKEFSIWLLKRLKWFYGSLILGDNFSITLKPEHIGKISGLSYSGIHIAENCLRTDYEKLSFMNRKLGFLGSGTSILQAAENYLLQEFPRLVTKETTDNFKIAFVIFVMGRFLAPSADNPDGNHNFWGALENPDQIASFNWSAYVLSNIKDAARHTDWEKAYNKPLCHVAGCKLILEIFYLDNIDFGALNLSHEIFPRWRGFSNDSLSAMIQADKRVGSISGSRSIYGRTKVLREPNTCYTFGKSQSTLTAPNIVTTSPPLYPTSQCRIAMEEPSTPDYSSSDTSVPIIGGLRVRTILKNAPDIEKHVLDFSDYIMKKYQGQVDPKLIDDLKVHNARCLKHLSNSYRSLTADIVKENINIAIKVIEQHNSYTPNTIVPGINENCPPLRRRYNDFLSGTDASPEGEDNLIHSKIPRTTLAVGPNGGPSSSNNTAPVIMESEILTRQNCFPGTESIQTSKHSNNPYVGATPNSPSDVNEHGIIKNDLLGCLPSVQAGAAKRSAMNIVLPVTNSPSQVQFPAKKNNHTYDGSYTNPPLALDMKPPQKACTSDPKVRSSITREIETPEATIKMAHFSPNVSPTSENQLFSGACLSVRMLESINIIDLNSSTFEAQYNDNYYPKKIVCVGSFSLSHWEMNLNPVDVDPNLSDSFYKWFINTSNKEFDSDWIIHHTPRFLKISGSDLKEQFTMQKPMSFDLFDLAIRRMKQLDKDLYPLDIPLRWRHLLESDYSLHVLGSENPVENNSIRDQFTGPECVYEISRCRMFFVPVFVHGNWWCYAWDLKNAVVFIIDPSVGTQPDSIVVNKHIGSINKLSKLLSSTANELFIGWSPIFPDCRPSVLRFGRMTYPTNKTGILTLFCIMNFDGTKLVTDPTEIHLESFRSYILYQLLSIRDNVARKPSAYVHYHD